MRPLPILDRLARGEAVAGRVDLTYSREPISTWRDRWPSSPVPLSLPLPSMIFGFRCVGLMGRAHLAAYAELGGTPRQFALALVRSQVDDSIIGTPFVELAERPHEFGSIDPGIRILSSGEIRPGRSMADESKFNSMVIEFIEPIVAALAMLANGVAVLKPHVFTDLSRKERKLRAATGLPSQYLHLGWKKKRAPFDEIGTDGHPPQISHRRRGVT